MLMLLMLLPVLLPNDPANSAGADSADAETVADYAADVDTPVADYADAGAEAPVDAPTATA